MTCRRFRLNTHLTMPLELFSGPGTTYAMHEPGDVVALDGERCRVHDRFLRGRIRAGDLTELEDAPSPIPTFAAPPVTTITTAPAASEGAHP